MKCEILLKGAIARFKVLGSNLLILISYWATQNQVKAGDVKTIVV